MNNLLKQKVLENKRRQHAFVTAHKKKLRDEDKPRLREARRAQMENVKAVQRDQKPTRIGMFSAHKRKPVPGAHKRKPRLLSVTIRKR